MNQPIIISLNKDTPVNMKKLEIVSLSKDGENIKEVMMGLAWQNAQGKTKEVLEEPGFLGKLFGAKPVSRKETVEVDEIDLDASILCYDKNGNVVETIYFGRKVGANGKINHMGDDRVGGGNKLDNEQIYIKLAEMPANIETLFATVSSFRGQTFSDIESASCRLVDTSTNKEDVNINLSAKGNYTGIIMAKIYRYGDGWLIKSIEESCFSRTVKDLEKDCKKFI